MSGRVHRAHRVRGIGCFCRFTREAVLVPVLGHLGATTHGIAILDNQFLAAQEERYLLHVCRGELRDHDAVEVLWIAHCNLASLWGRLAGDGLRDGLILAVDSEFGRGLAG